MTFEILSYYVTPTVEDAHGVEDEAAGSKIWGIYLFYFVKKESPLLAVMSEIYWQAEGLSFSWLSQTPTTHPQCRAACHMAQDTAERSRAVGVSAENWVTKIAGLWQKIKPALAHFYIPKHLELIVAINCHHIRQDYIKVI